MPPVLLDTNVLVHAAYRGSTLYHAASALVGRGLREAGVYCISPQNLVEFCAVVTRRRFVQPPMSPTELRRIASLLYASRRLQKIYPMRGTVRRAIQEGAALGITGPRWYDLYLAITMRDALVRVIVTENVGDFDAIPFVAAHRIMELP